MSAAARMTRREAVRRLRGAAEDDPTLASEARGLFRAIFGRDPDEDDGDAGDLVSHCYAAIGGAS